MYPWSSCLHLLSAGLDDVCYHSWLSFHFPCHFGFVLCACVRLLDSLGSPLLHGCFKGVVCYSAATCLFYTPVDFLTLVLKNIFQVLKLQFPCLKVTDGANSLCDLLQIPFHSVSQSFFSNSGNSNTKLLNE